MANNESKAFKNKLSLPIELIIVLASIVFLILPGINGQYTLCQEILTKKESIKIKIIKDDMQVLKSKIWRLEERIRKSPDKISYRSEVIELREKYLKIIEKYIKELEMELKDNPGNTKVINKEISLLEEKKDFFFKIKDDYIQCVELNIKELTKIRNILQSNPERIRNISIELFNSENIFKIIDEFKYIFFESEGNLFQGEERQETSSNLNTKIARIDKFIMQEIIECIKKRKDCINEWDVKILDTETKLMQIKKNYIEILVEKINDSKSEKEINTLRARCLQLLNDCIKQVKEELQENLGDTNLEEELNKLKEKKEKIAR